MKIIFLLGLTLLLNSTQAFASNECPQFPYDLTEEEVVKEVRSFWIDQDTKLSEREEARVLATAKMYELNADEQDVKKAIEHLASASEGGDILYTVFRFQNQRYIQVKHYPGGNPYGAIFKGTKIIAEQTDGDIRCISGVR